MIMIRGHETYEIDLLVYAGVMNCVVPPLIWTFIVSITRETLHITVICRGFSNLGRLCMQKNLPGIER